MRFKNVCQLAIVLSTWLLTGCATSTLTRLEDLSTDEAILAARFHIVFDDNDVTEGTWVLFDAPAFGANKYSYQLDKTGYVFARLPIGLNHMSGFLYNHNLHQCRDKEVTFQLVGNGVVNDLGNVTVNWHVDKESQAGWELSKMRFKIATNTPQTAVEFRNRYGTTRQIVPSAVVIHPEEGTRFRLY